MGFTFVFKAWERSADARGEGLSFVIVLLVALFMSLGLANLDFSHNWWRGQLLRLAVGFPILLVYAYVEMPPLVFPQAFGLLLFTLVPNAVYSSLLAARTAIARRRVVSIRRTPLWRYLIPVGVVAAFVLILLAAPYVDASGLRDLVDVKVSNSLPTTADVKHVRIVPEEAADFAGDKVVGQLGAYYRVGEFNVQVANGRLVWVAPLEFHGFVQWLSRRTSPGVIIVSAEDPDAQPELRQRAPMRYIPSALFNENLYRHVYMRYGTELIMETTMQLDADGNPQYLCTLGRPTIGFTGERVTGVVIVDPVTGEMRRIDRSDFASLPAWVSRVVPDDLALAYNEWFGQFVHGLWNYLLVKRDVHVPARDEVFGLLDGTRFVWFVDHTSPAADQSMTGFTYMDTVTGAMTYYTSSGGEFNSRGAEQAVASNPIVRQGKLFPTQPLLYNAFGHNTWVVPLVAETGKFQTVALVEAQNGHVVVGSSSSPKPQDDAFAQYAVFLGVGVPTALSIASERLQSGAIDRVAVAPDGSVYLTLRGARRMYVVDSHVAPEALLARSGDHVTFKVDPTDGGSAHAEDFNDAALAQP
jgi:hypothetical protein